MAFFALLNMGLTRRHRLMNRFPSESVRNPPENTFIRRRIGVNSLFWGVILTFSFFPGSENLRFIRSFLRENRWEMIDAVVPKCPKFQ